jgi:hypothetical protein
MQGFHGAPAGIQHDEITCRGVIGLGITPGMPLDDEPQALEQQAKVVHLCLLTAHE